MEYTVQILLSISQIELFKTHLFIGVADGSLYESFRFKKENNGDLQISRFEDVLGYDDLMLRSYSG